jgi:hypothetical protein
MSYTNYLARIRAHNYLASQPTCDTDEVVNPPDPPQLPDMGATTCTCTKNTGRTILAQSRIRNKPIVQGTTFDISSNSLLCKLPFISGTTSCPHCNPYTSLDKRLICISVRFLLSDVTPDCVGHVFLSVIHGNNNIYNLCHEYTTGPSNLFSGTIAFETYVDVPGPSATHNIFIHGTCTSATGAISADRGCYSDTFPAGMSYVTIEDAGQI